LAENCLLIYRKLTDDQNKTKFKDDQFTEGQIVFKPCTVRQSIRILSTVLIILLLGNIFAFAEDKYFLGFSREYFADLSFLNQNDQDESATIHW